jgi:hypothetical protein
MAFNIVELAASIEDDNSAFDQRCIFGHRVEGHAVYCHNDNWDDSPRKCRRSWYTDGEIKDEDCAGFQPNPAFKGEFSPTPISEPLCSKCRGSKRISADKGRIATCPLCMGSGSQPGPISLTQFEQDTLERGMTHSGRHDTAGHPFVRMAKTETEHESIDRLSNLELVVVRSVSFAGDISAYLLENTMKGEAVMRANWEAAKGS